MITEDYVSFETSKLLKKKGFDWESFASIKVFRGHRYKVNGEWITPKEDTIIPTLQTAMKWLEEKYGIFCIIRRYGNKDVGFTYSWNCEGEMGLSVGNDDGFKSVVEACEAAIRYCLENLIQIWMTSKK